MSNDIQPQDLIFENVVPTDEKIITLYELLKQRTHNISHSVIPRFSEHSNFVRYNPYRAWFLLYLKDRYIGSIYITLENVLGVNILDPYIEICLETVVAKVMSEIDPLPLLPSVRAGDFSINVPISNEAMANKLETMGFIPSQITFKKN